ncbi:nucleolar protein 58 [Anopheles aquasalis]|uniref:nucleolar protein 58 n=1 Tax=Anopheles aquasalis TaxID=42839 RepID=UPI00215A7E99|nr:nucleolar protein 58 [Anopheles aquasalis]
MGKLNKKLLNKPKVLAKPSTAEGKKVVGPFPIYRSTPVQLNGPEPKSFKIPEATRKATKKTTRAVKGDEPAKESAPKSRSSDSEEQQEDGLKVKKLRKLAISRLTKKEKKQFKKDEMLKKIELTKVAFKQEKERKQREKTVITGDMRPLLDALPALDELYQIKSSGKLKTGVPQFDKKAKPKTKKQLKTERLKKSKREFISRCRSIKKVLKNKEYRKDPKKMIAEHIRKARKDQFALLMGEAGI